MCNATRRTELLATDMKLSFTSSKHVYYLQPRACRAGMAHPERRVPRKQNRWTSARVASGPQKYAVVAAATSDSTFCIFLVTAPSGSHRALRAATFSSASFIENVPIRGMNTCSTDRIPHTCRKKYQV